MMCDVSCRRGVCVAARTDPDSGRGYVRRPHGSPEQVPAAHRDTEQEREQAPVDGATLSDVLNS